MRKILITFVLVMSIGGGICSYAGESYADRKTGTRLSVKAIIEPQTKISIYPIDTPEWQTNQSVSNSAPPPASSNAQKLNMSFSAGKPGEYHFYNALKVIVRSNGGTRTVRLHVHPMKSGEDEIPAEQIFVKINDEDYQSAEKDLILVDGPPSKPDEEVLLKFKVKITETTRAGSYDIKMEFITVPAL